MIKISVCYSNKNGQEFSSCGLSDVEIDHAMLDNPAALRDRIAECYSVCEQMVHSQLGTTPISPAGAPQVNPAVTRSNAPPPVSSSAPPVTSPATSATTSSPPPVTSATTSSPPKTGKQLAGWAKNQGCLDWFARFGASQKPSPLPKLLSSWSDEWAVYAHGQYLATLQAAAPPSTNGNGRH